jgi:hypothetical protein
MPPLTRGRPYVLAGCSKPKPAAVSAAVHDVNAPKLGLVAGFADGSAVAAGTAAPSEVRLAWAAA